MAKAVAVLSSSEGVNGTVYFIQEGDGIFHFHHMTTYPTTITGNVSGLKPGLHGFHVHALGDTTNGCDEAMDNKDDEELELQFREPITRSRAKKLQAYLQVLIRRKLEIGDEEIKRSNSKIVNLLTIEDQEHTMEN
ncbi:copper/zinc superoxide dismutase 1 [Perilla frutescens var. hirtella]|uniref:superoxide dismutase n=1 Tax=Perilla frutescens var. hirtella TaxID=608512 RepID=A0AAD4IWK2_PERFH|nr:copper/zinc superoxide dismutase 1 [Perilla frutescens var. hirtella]